MYIGAVLKEFGNAKHITVTFNNHNESKDEYKNAVAALAICAAAWDGGPLLARLAELERFEPAGVWVTAVDAEVLHKFRDELTNCLDMRDVYWSNEYEYRPHITMTKWKEPKQPLTGLLVIDKLSVVSDEFGTTEVVL